MYLLKRISFLVFFFSAGAFAAFQDTSTSIFLPESLQNLAQTAQKFPFFWRGLYLIDAQNEEVALKQAIQFCEILKKEDTVADYFCTQNNFKQNQRHLRDWVRDASLREPIPPLEDFISRAEKQLAYASLPTVPREFLATLRIDPLGVTQDFWSIKQKTFSFPDKIHGFFSNKEKNLIIIPFSFNTSPQNIESTRSFFENVKSLCENDCPKSVLLGPHAAIALNQNRVIEDLRYVSLLGFALFAVTMILMGWKRGLALLSLCVPLVIALLIAIATTVWAFGSIHGLTLAFGPSLVGLVLDYGIHTKIHQGSKEAWSSNLFGFLTTLSGFVALSFSEIPLVRQLMFFALVGLLTSFVFYYFFSQSKSRLWTGTQFKVFSFQMKPHGWRGPFSFLLLVAAFVLWPFITLDLNLRNFEFREKDQSELESKMGSSGMPEMMFSVAEAQEYSMFDQERVFAFDNGIAQQSWATYVPSLKAQNKNLASWANACNTLKFTEVNAQRFFAPFYDLNLCHNKVATPQHIPSYANDFVSLEGAEFLSVWFPKNAEQKELLKSTFPQVTSMRSLFESFPHLLMKDIMLMFPLSLFLCFALIFYHVRKVSYSFLALVPMFCSVGLVFMASFLFSKSLSFVSCVALLMIFGSSVDYGIFKVDSLRETPSPEADAKIFSSLLMNALLTFVGYLPLAFAQHPVLNDLGWVLTWGTLGAFLGGVWGVSYVSSFKFVMRKS